MTDADFLLHVLRDGEWHSRDAILAESFRVRGCGLTVHSRISNLRERGHTIKCDVRGGSRRSSFYRLVGALDEAAAESNPPSRTKGCNGEPAAVAVSSSASPSYPGPVSLEAPTMIAQHGAGADDGALESSPGVEPYRAAAAGNGGGESLPPFGDSGSTSTPGDLLLFACTPDESAGLRGAYYGDAA